MYKHAYHYIVWAKRQRQREIKAAATAESPKATGKGQGTHWHQITSEEESGSDSVDMDISKGTAHVRWTEGAPDEGDDLYSIRKIVIDNFCGYSLLQFWQEVDDRFDISLHKQRREALVHIKKLTSKEAQIQAHETGLPAVFRFRTEDADIEEEGKYVPLTEVPEPDAEGENMEVDKRETKYRDMVDAAVHVNAETFNMNVRLWQYNLMLAEARTADHVVMRNITLDLEHDGHDEISAEDVADEHTLQVSRSHVH